MNAKFANLFKLLATAAVISVTAGCASVQTAFAPGMVAQAKSAGSEAIGVDSPALVPGSVDLTESLGASRVADAARWNAMATYFSAKEAASLEGARAADASRWNAMAVHFADHGALVPASVDLSASVQAGRVADAARWNAMAAYFSAKEAASLARARTADAARWNAMGQHVPH